MKISEDLEKWLKRLVILIFFLIIFFFCKSIGIIKGIINILIALTPLYVAIFISWLMKPMAKFMNNKLKIKYNLACYLAIIFLLIIIGILIFTIIPEIFYQIKVFIASLSTSITNLLKQLEELGLFNENSRLFAEINTFLSNYNLSINSIFTQGLSWLKDHSNLITNGVYSTLSVLQSTIGVVSQIGLGFLLSLYLMPNFDHYSNLFIRKIRPEQQKEVYTDLRNISVKLRQYLWGLLLDGISIFIILSILITIFFGHKIGYLTAIVFCLIAALFNIISYVGPIIGAVPLALVVFQHFGIGGMILVIILISLAQFVESNFIYPRIMGNSINMHPVTLMIGLLIFSTLFGMVGMFISTPLLTIIKIFLVKFGIIEEDDL